MKQPTKEERKNAYQMLYTKISKATAEINGKKQIYRGELRKELFSEIRVSSFTITRFMWAITHKTEVLPVILFSVKKDGNKGVIVERLHSGFYNDQRKHVIGSELVPFIMESAAKCYKPKSNKVRNTTCQNKQETDSNKPVISQTALNVGRECELALAFNGLCDVSDDTLSYFGREAQKKFNEAKADLDRYNEEVQRRTKVREAQAKLQTVLELAEMSKEELLDLLNII